jgi:hypothetical protein
MRLSTVSAAPRVVASMAAHALLIGWIGAFFADPPEPGHSSCLRNDPLPIATPASRSPTAAHPTTASREEHRP